MNDDPKLREILADWKVSPPPAPGFSACVWGRVRAAQEYKSRGVLTAVRNWFLLELPRPAYAAGLLAAAMIVGLSVANLQARHMRERYRLEQARQYLASIDPLSMMGAERE
jgi:hypothetical protein